MKRIIFLVLALQILLVSVCSSFEPPTDDRWLWVGSDSKLGFWIDSQSIEYRISKNYSHENHKQMDIWILSYDASQDKSSMQRWTYDLNCDKNKIISIILYDKQGNVSDSRDLYYEEFKSVVPGSWGESILKMCKLIWEIDIKNTYK